MGEYLRALGKSFRHGFGLWAGFGASATNRVIARTGRGVLRRARQYSAHWQPHLERTKEEVHTWLSNFPVSDCGNDRSHGNIVGVLGAGHLLDLDLATLTKHFSQTILFDADKQARRAFLKRSDVRNVVWQEQDITGVLAKWEQQLTKAFINASWKDALEHIETVPQLSLAKTGELPLCQFANFAPWTAVISLNILSQLPIVWQDTVEELLKRHFSKQTVRNGEAAWLQRLARGAQLLCLQHLRSLQASGAKSILIITDIEYVHYQNYRRFRNHNAALPPLSFDTSTRNWGHTEKIDLGSRRALSYEVNNALFGLDLENPAELSRLFPDYELTSSSTWLWHIQPQGLEKMDSGVIHRVLALSLTRILGAGIK